MASGGAKAVLAALGANAGIAVAKFVGFLVTGSSSMVAEAVHSVADTANQGLLLLGGKRARRAADEQHPFGYGRNRYFYAFVVALLLFTLGAVFSVYEGIHKIEQPEPVESPLVAVVIIVIALGLEGASFRTAVQEARHARSGSGGSWWSYVRTARTPETLVVLCEDAGALLGLVFALAGVGLSTLTGDPVWDGIATVGIGVLLGVIAIVLIVETKSLLIGEGAREGVVTAIVSELEQNAVRKVLHIRTEHLAPDQLLVAAKIELTRGLSVPEVAAAIDDAEARVRTTVPTARLIYLEPDLDRTSSDGRSDQDSWSGQADPPAPPSTPA